MSRATQVLGATSIVGLLVSLWLYVDNRSLRHELAGRAAPAITATAGSGSTTAAAAAAAASPSRTAAAMTRTAVPPPPQLPATPDETRMERRARRTDEIAQLLGRFDGETEDEYKQRILPLLQAGLLAPRLRAEEMRKAAEDKAHVTAEQSAKLDRAFDKVYSDVIDFANKAVADG